jgi:hypothetical protein
MSQRPARSEAKAIRKPFGDQLGYSSTETCRVIRRTREPLVFIT